MLLLAGGVGGLLLLAAGVGSEGLADGVVGFEFALVGGAAGGGGVAMDEGDGCRMRSLKKFKEEEEQENIFDDSLVYQEGSIS